MTDRPICRSGRCPNWAQRSCRGMCKKHYAAWLAAHPPVDSAIVAEHIAELRAAGIGWRTISRRAGVAMSTVRDIGCGVTTITYQPTAIAILALDADRDPMRVGTIGVTRRLRALVALGHTETALADMVGTSQGYISRYILANDDLRFCLPAFAARVDAAFRVLEIQPQPAGWVADRARRRAAKRGWLPPLAWDPEMIDDPAAEPCASAIRQQRKVTDTLEDFRIEYLEQRDYVGLSDHAIAEKLHISYDLLLKRLSRLHIPTQTSDRRAS